MKQINWERIRVELTFKKVPKIKTLSEEQYNLLNKIAEKSKMDCWFLVKQHVKGKYAGEDYVFDLENRKQMTLKAGVNELVEGITSEDLELLTDKEIRVLEDVIIGVNL